MKVLLCAIAVAVIANGLILLVQAQGIEQLNNKDLVSLLEEALKRLKEDEVHTTSDLDSALPNMTSILGELTQAIQNNTREIAKKMSGDGSFEFSENADQQLCEMPFHPLGSECFYVNKYKRVSWSEARKFCKGLGSDLAEPTRVNSLRAMLLAKYPEDENKFFWIGASESGNEGNWTWISSRRVQTADWTAGQPDGGNENCIVLSRDDHPPLHDSPCYTHTMFICERIVLRRQ